MFWFGKTPDETNNKTATEELLDEIRKSLEEKHSEWNYDELTEDDDELTRWLEHKEYGILIDWSANIDDDKLLCMDLPNATFAEKIALTYEQRQQVITWRDEWKATYMLRRMLK